MSSPITSARKPPAATTVSRWNTPKAPDTIRRPLIALQPRRPPRKARRYSTTCTSASGFFGRPDLLDHAAAYLAAVDDAHRAAAGDRARVLEEGPHDVLEAPHLQHRVRVAAIEDRVAGGVQACIRRIRLAAVLLVDDAQVRVLERAVHAAHGLRLDLDAIGLRKRRELELADQRAERVVLRAVVDDDDLEVLVAQLQQRPHRRRDRAFFVVGRHHERHGHLQVRVDTLGRGDAAHVAAQPVHRDEREPHVDHVQQDEVAEKAPLHGLQGVAENVHRDRRLCRARARACPARTRRRAASRTASRRSAVMPLSAGAPGQRGSAPTRRGRTSAARRARRRPRRRAAHTRRRGSGARRRPRRPRSARAPGAAVGSITTSSAAAAISVSSGCRRSSSIATSLPSTASTCESHGRSGGIFAGASESISARIGSRATSAPASTSSRAIASPGQLSRSASWFMMPGIARCASMLTSAAAA